MRKGDMAKTERYTGIARVIRTGHACIGCMGWESPYVDFEFEDGRNITWHSDSVESILYRFDHLTLDRIDGVRVGVDCLVRGDRVWRMKSMKGAEK